MTNMKKLASLLLALVMVLAMAVPAMAEETTTTTGSITINDAVVGQTYTVYQILDLESYDPTAGAYAYKANSAWATWLATQTEYVSIDAQGYVTWKTGASAADFAKAAQKYAQENKLTNQGQIEATTTTVEFTNLDLGYYLVDTTLGTLCSLDTTNPNVVMEEKNEVPTVEKEVQEDSTSAWGETNDADISQTVNYRATITVQAGAENYVLHDTMSAGLTYTGVTSVKIGENTVDSTNYTVTAPGKSCEDGCTFEVAFDNEYIASLTAGTQIVVSYSATLNENAEVGLEGNPNEVELQYGDENHPSYTPKDETITYTWDMDVLKYANGNESTVLEGVKFVLLNKNKDKVATVEGGKLTGWVELPAEGAEWNEAAVLTTDKDGKIAIDGLDADTYYLREIEALPGYNKLADDVQVVVEAAKKVEDELTYTTVVAKVNNQSGAELPSTGGTGTTVIYVVGGVLVLAAVVLLITKKRMSSEK